MAVRDAGWGARHGDGHNRIAAVRIRQTASRVTAGDAQRQLLRGHNESRYIGAHRRAGNRVMTDRTIVTGLSRLGSFSSGLMGSDRHFFQFSTGRLSISTNPLRPKPAVNLVTFRKRINDCQNPPIWADGLWLCAAYTLGQRTRYRGRDGGACVGGYDGVVGFGNAERDVGGYNIGNCCGA
jgi:hypothetical protein